MLNTFTIDDQSALAEKVNAIQDGFAIFWLYHNLCLARICDGQLAFAETPGRYELRDIARVRLFDSEREFHIWRSGPQLKGRELIGTRSGYPAFTETQLRVVGKVAEQVLRLCPELLDPKGRAEDQIAVRTRDYIDFNEIGQATYVDSQLLGFINTKNSSHGQ